MNTLALDGVYVCNEEGELVFHPLPEPTVADVTDVATRTVARIERVLEQHGRYLDEPSDGSSDKQLSLDYPALASCYQAATSGRQLLDEHPGKPALRLVGTPKARKHAAPAALVAEVRGVNVHAERVVDGRDRKQLERLCRYLARPPLRRRVKIVLPDRLRGARPARRAVARILPVFEGGATPLGGMDRNRGGNVILTRGLSHERLSELPNGKLSLALKTPWSDGTRAIVLSPMDLRARARRTRTSRWF